MYRLSKWVNRGDLHAKRKKKESTNSDISRMRPDPPTQTRRINILKVRSPTVIHTKFD